MKRILLAFAFLLAGAINAQAQSTVVSGTVTDAGSQVWAGGTYKFTFTPNPAFPTSVYTWTGGALNTVISGVLDGSGHYSVSIPSNSAISPVNSTWILQVRPDATSASFSTPATTITGGTQTLNVTPPAILIPWTNPPGPAISAYADAEIGGGLPKGAEYFNTTTNLTRVWNGTTWANQGGGGGGGTCPAGVAGLIQYTNGTNCASDASLTHNAATLSTTVLGNGTSSVSTFAADAGGLFGLTVDAGAGQVTLAANDVAGRILDFESTGGTDINSSGNVSLNGVTGVSVQVGNASPITPGSVTQRSVTGTTDTILNTDRQNRIVYNSASAVAVTLAQAGTSGFDGGFNTRISNQNTGVVTVTPTVSTINGAATLVLQEGQFCFITPSSTGTAWAADCGESQMTAGAGISFTRGVHSLIINNTGLTGITFPQTVGGTVNSGGIPYFNSTTQMSSSAAGTVNTLMKWGGAGNPPIASGVTDDGTTVSSPRLVNFSGTGAASTSPFLLNGTPFLAGTGTTNFPYFYLDFGASKPTSFSTGGELVSINGPSGFLGNFISFHTNGGAALFSVSSSGAINTLSTISAVGVVQGSKLQSSTNCSSSASPAVCAAASMGTVNIAAAATTITVNTTAVTANSEIMVVEDSSLGTKLGVTCNTTIARTYAVTARTAATSFVITTSAAPVTNPACLSYWVMN